MAGANNYSGSPKAIIPHVKTDSAFLVAQFVTQAWAGRPPGQRRCCQKYRHSHGQDCQEDRCYWITDELHLYDDHVMMVFVDEPEWPRPKTPAGYTVWAGVAIHSKKSKDLFRGELSTLEKKLWKVS